MQSVNGTLFLNVTFLSCLSATATLTTGMVPLTNQGITQKSFSDIVFFYLGNLPPSAKHVDCFKEPWAGENMSLFLLAAMFSTSEIIF